MSICTSDFISEAHVTTLSLSLKKKMCGEGFEEKHQRGAEDSRLQDKIYSDILNFRQGFTR